ncbi:hypothetical protein B0H14DRAFT_3871556 [Mycena olivaceomarginata]|nr:hypothetical protein B0H14DRAFT_3871556 [Mycena olivaceomarginata]
MNKRDKRVISRALLTPGPRSSLRASVVPRMRPKQRLLELESKHRLEDAQALNFTGEQRMSLFLSFRSVKLEWSDLNGMRFVRCRDPIPIFWHPTSCPQTDARASAVLPPRLAAPVGRPLPLPATPHRHAGPNPPARTPAFATRQCALLILPRARSAPTLLTPAGGIRGPRPPHQRAPVSFGTDDTICVRRPSYSSPSSTHSTHAVAFPVSPH